MKVDGVAFFRLNTHRHTNTEILWQCHIDSLLNRELRLEALFAIVRVFLCTCLFVYIFLCIYGVCTDVICSCDISCQTNQQQCANKGTNDCDDFFCTVYYLFYQWTICLVCSFPLFSLVQKYCSWISSTTTARHWHRCCSVWFRTSRVS